MSIRYAIVAAAGALSLAAASAASAGTGYPVSPLNNTQTFFDGGLGGQSGVVTISGASYAYNPAAGDLVMEVVVTNQDNVPNDTSNGYFQADYTGTDVVRSYLVTDGAPSGPDTGALVTQFNAGPTLGSPDSGNCYPFNCNDSGTSTGQSIDYFEIYRAGAFSGPINISSISFFDAGLGTGDNVLNGTYDITFSTLAVPEPAAWVMMLAGFGGLGLALRSRRRPLTAAA